MSDTDIHIISTVENPGLVGNRYSGGSNDDLSALPMTGLVQPQQPHWPQHHTAHNHHHHHHLHSSNYVLDGDEDPDDFDYDDYGGGSGPGTPAAPVSPVSSSTTRPKRGSSIKRLSHTGSRKSGMKN